MIARERWLSAAASEPCLFGELIKRLLRSFNCANGASISDQKLVATYLIKKERRAAWREALAAGR